MLNSSSRARGGFDALTCLALAEEFEAERAYELYEAYRQTNTEEALMAAFEAAVPSIRLFLKKIRHRGATINELVSIISWAYYVEIKRQKIIADNGADSYVSALRWVCFRSCKSYLSLMRANRIFKRSQVWYCRPMPYGHVLDQVDVEHKIFLEELPKTIALNIVPRLRFKGKHLKACKQILFNMLTSQKTFTGQIAHMFDIPAENVKVLVDHVRVQIKAYIHEMRNTFQARIMEDWRDVYDMIHIEDGIDEEN